jgi:hypothetical protein
LLISVHDFFKPQPEKNASIFFLKHIMHDWSDPYCSKILDQLYEAATPTTRLIVMEVILPYACHDQSADSRTGIPGGTLREALAPLLANWGATNVMVYHADICVSTSLTCKFYGRVADWLLAFVVDVPSLQFSRKNFASP